MDDLVFLHGSHMPVCVSRVDKHFDGYYTLQYMHRGAVKLRYDQQRYMLRGRWFWPAYPGPHIVFHAAEENGSLDHRYVAFRGRQVERWMADGLMPGGPQPAPRGKPYVRRFDELIDLSRQGRRLARLRARHLLESILLDLADGRDHHALRRAPWLDGLLERLSDPDQYPHDYEALARESGMSASTLRRRFRQEMGVPIHRFALLGRITAAQSLLVGTILPIKTVADRLRFRDVYFFSRQFQQITGLSPGRFRKSRAV
jgi:AraC family transcriptional regulator of arabinose operon